jgi:hypothetical protein
MAGRTAGVVLSRPVAWVEGRVAASENRRSGQPAREVVLAVGRGGPEPEPGATPNISADRSQPRAGYWTVRVPTIPAALWPGILQTKS